MKGTFLASSATALVAMLAVSTTLAVPVEKRLMMALSLQASPTLPSLSLGELIPTPTLPPIASEIQSVVTSVIDGVTKLITTTIPSPTLPAELQDSLPSATLSVAVSGPTPPPQVEVLANLAQGALNALPSMLMKNLQDIQSMASSAIAAAATATVTPIPTEYTTIENGKECTKTSLVTPAQTLATAASGVINPLSILVSGLPQPTGVVGGATSIIGDITSALTLPSLPLPTSLLPLLGKTQLPEIDLPGLLGDKQNTCIKDAQGNQVGLCGSGPLINDSETLAL
ncbi:uncharacterized protein MEPE_00962 [Melanopsichium pennsylvanicum]|uniref:Uncharacterized protein n=2 Tax=Melanopsichium pennsylvanicum TaxID=63383 RepID=A0AAJ4XIC7_9BASI|nr:hypothetical protein BN887_03796 [Melanopsichium pennsylvanicum 4]SNX82256.1 uncharacterized protein MEPE_00962 [Melanopsichium pennsylvanicum]